MRRGDVMADPHPRRGQ